VISFNRFKKFHNNLNLNIRHLFNNNFVFVFAQRAKVCPAVEDVFAQRAKVCPAVEDVFAQRAKVCPAVEDVFAQRAKVCPAVEDVFAQRAKVCPAVEDVFAQRAKVASTRFLTSGLLLNVCNVGNVAATSHSLGSEWERGLLLFTILLFTIYDFSFFILHLIRPPRPADTPPQEGNFFCSSF
jgi:hypothetical protein